MAWSHGFLGRSTTASSDPIEDTLPATLKETRNLASQSRILGSFMSKVDDGWKKRMACEDKHTVNKCDSLKSLVQELDLDLSCLFLEV